MEMKINMSRVSPLASINVLRNFENQALINMPEYGHRHPFLKILTLGSNAAHQWEGLPAEITGWVYYERRKQDL